MPRRKARSLGGTGSWTRQRQDKFISPALLARANVGHVVLERIPAVNRGGLGRSKVANEYQRLQVIGESPKRVRESAIIGVVFQRVADFHEAVVVAVDEIVGKRVVHPFANFVRQSGDVLREGAFAVHVRSVRVGLAAGLSTVGVVITADATTTRSQKDVIGDEQRQNAWVDLGEIFHVGLQLRIERVDVVGADDPASEWVVEDSAQRSWNGNGPLRQYGRRSQQDMIASVCVNELPEVTALEGVDVLGGSEVGAALGEVDARVKDGRGNDVVDHGLAVTEHVALWIEGAITVGRAVHHFDRNDVYRHGGGGAALRRRGF